MSSAGGFPPENPNPNSPPPMEEEQQLSKKAAKKQAAKLHKLRLRGEEGAPAATATASAAADGEDDPLSGNYGDLPLPEIQSKEEVRFPYTGVDALGHELKDDVVLVRGTAQTVRAVGKKMAFVVLRDGWSTVQCVVTEKQGVVSKAMVKFAAALSRESIVDVEGIVSVPDVPIKGATQQVFSCSCPFYVTQIDLVFAVHQLIVRIVCCLDRKVEIQVRKLYCVSRASPNLPFNLEDAARSDAEIVQSLYRMFLFGLF